jgi:aldoxime dehydratase
MTEMQTMKDVDQLEPAIPEHLRVQRTQPLSAPDGFQPVSISFSARFDPKVKTLPMAYYGVQYKQRSAVVEKALAAQSKAFAEVHGPRFWDRAEYVDELGYVNSIAVAYWDHRDTYEAWRGHIGDNWWFASGPLDGDVGFFKECYTPGVEDTETTFSHPYPEGYSHLADHWSEPTDSHEYWGSARDRLPRAQTDPLLAPDRPSSSLVAGENTFGRHVVIEPHQNLCLLRSGQDWEHAESEERKMYVSKVEPVLRKGMLEIRDKGKSLGCIYNRYMTLVTADGPQEKTYSLSAWHSLADIETWVKQATHLAIYRIGLNHYEEFGLAASLRLYHEMFVLKAADQAYEYVNCHPRTGMLNAVV